MAGFIKDPIPYDGKDADTWLKAHPDDLFWISAKDGFYVHRPMAIGQIIMRHTPEHVEPWPAKTAIFKYNFPTIPGVIIGQARDFFRRIYNKYKTEAEVLILFNDKTNEVRLFVPPQDCSHGGVHSAFNPEHVAKDWQLIGSIHSHCDFGAGHSGTDTGDASEFDGIHITIGHVNKDMPSFASMVMINRYRVDYKIEDIADISDLESAKAPEWWDRYVIQKEGTPQAIIDTWKAFRPAPKPVQQHAPKWQQNNGPRPIFSGLSDNHEWDIDYTSADTNHDWDTSKCPCTTWDQHVQARWPKSKRKVAAKQIGYQSRPPDPYGNHWGRGSEDFRPRGVTPSNQLTRKIRKRAQGKKYNNADDTPFEGRVIDIINEFHGILLDMEDLDLYPGDLVEVTDLLRPEDIVTILAELGVTLEAEEQNDKKREVKIVTPTPCLFCQAPTGHKPGCSEEPKALPATVQVPGQMTVDDLLPTP